MEISEIEKGKTTKKWRVACFEKISIIGQSLGNLQKSEKTN